MDRNAAANALTVFHAAMKRRLAPLLPALAVAVGSCVWLARRSPLVLPVNDDPIRDQLMMRDCVDLDLCHPLGALSSFADLYHGAVWVDLLAAIHLLGGDMLTQRLVVLVLLALSAATLFVVVWRWLRPTLALPAAVLLVAGLSIDAPATLLINPSAAIFFDVLTLAGLLAFALSRRPRFLLVAAFTLGIAASMHTASFVLVVPFAIIVAMTRPRAPWDVLLGATVALLTYALPSSAALRANVLALSAHGWLMPGAVAGLGAVLLALPLGPLFRRLSWNARAWTIGALLVVPYAAVLLWLLRVQGHQFATIYLHPVLAPIAVAGAAVLAIPFEWLGRWRAALRFVPTLAALTLSVWLLFDGAYAVAPRTPFRGTWTLGETQAVASALAERGWHYDDLVLRLQGNGCRELLAGMSAAGSPPRPPTKASRQQVQVVVADRGAFAVDDDVVPIGSRAARIRVIDSWLRPEALKACHASLTAGATAVCGGPLTISPDRYARDRRLFVSRTYPLIETLDRIARPYVLTYEIPLAPGSGEIRDLSVLDEAATCGWRITRVEGVPFAGELPARRIRLLAAAPDAGLVVFEKSFGAPGCPETDIDPRYPPCVLETAPDDPMHNLVGQS